MVLNRSAKATYLLFNLFCVQRIPLQKWNFAGLTLNSGPVNRKLLRTFQKTKKDYYLYALEDSLGEFLLVLVLFSFRASSWAISKS